MKKLSLKELRRLLKNEGDRRRRANTKFANANKAGKRVLIAKDVLRQIAAGKIKAKHRVYLASKEISKIVDSVSSYHDSKEEKAVAKENGEKQMCDLFATAQDCQACALGSVFMAAVAIKDKLKVKDVAKHGFGHEIVGDDKMRKYLGGVFSEKQLFMIENAFEGNTINTIYRDGHHNDCECTTVVSVYSAGSTYQTCQQIDTELQDKLIAFNKGKRNARVALERVMQNVIDNEGTFVP